jgi:general stress protein CsbA
MSYHLQLSTTLLKQIIWLILVHDVVTTTAHHLLAQKMKGTKESENDYPAKK